MPTGAHPSGVHGPTTVTRGYVCGTRYHEAQGGTAAPRTCGCGTYAIGECATCNTPVCGDHSWMMAGQRLCRDCVAAANEREAAASRASRERAVAESQQRLDAERARVLTKLELTPAEAFDALVLDERTSDRRTDYWAARALLELAPSSFTRLAVDRLKRSGRRLQTERNYSGSSRSLVGKAILAARSYEFWDATLFGSLQLTPGGRWHEVRIVGERNVGHGMSTNEHRAGSVAEDEAVARIRAALEQIVQDAESRKIATG
jgi:hypothetical protein